MSVIRTDILGVGFDDVNMQEAIDLAFSMTEGGRHYCVTPNSEMVYEAMSDDNFRAVLNAADMVVPDGAGVIEAAKILRTPLKGKVAGVELAEGLLPLMAAKGKRLYLLGAKPGVAERAAEKMKSIAPGLVIAGTHDGYFSDDGAAVAAINAAVPDVVYVCLGFPRQEIFMNANRAEISAPLLIGLGGTLDVFAGEAKRAPAIFIRLNLEWFYRLLCQPSRLGRMMRLPKFLAAARREAGRKAK